jgi:ABC-2 type transport system permease protein
VSDFLRLVRKEARELLRPRYIVPILVVPIVFLAMGQGFSGVEDGANEEPAVGLVMNDSGQYADLLEETYDRRANVTYRGANVSAETAIEETRGSGGKTVIVVPSNFTERIEDGDAPGRVGTYTIVDNLGIAGITNAGSGTAPLGEASQVIAANATGAPPGQLSPITATQTSIVRGERVDASPSSISSGLLGQLLFVPVVIVVVIVFSGQMVMNSMGIENENKTMETLLTMPVARRTIVAAKLAGSAVIGLFAAGLLAGSMFYYQSSLSFGDGGGGLPAQFSLGPPEYALIGVSVFLAVVAALAMALCLGIFAGDQQGAQVLVLPIAFVAGAPAAVTVFTDIGALSLPLQAIVYANPFTYPSLAPKALLVGDPLVIVGGTVYQLVFAAAMVGLAVRLFGSDRVVTGDAGRLSDVFQSLQR